MFKKTIAAMLMTATVATGFVSMPAEARDRYGYDRYERGDRYNGGNRYRDRGDRYYRSDRIRSYRGDRYRQCDNGTGGTVVGAIAGGLLGNEVARRGDKTTGAIIGAAVGALAGRAIDKSDDPCRRR